MVEWVILDYIEPSGRNPVREWLDGLPAGDQAKIDYRLQHMQSMPRWSEKWVSKYQGTDDIFEIRVSGNKVEYRPLGSYHGRRRFVLLIGAIEKGDKIPKRDVETAIKRLANLQRGVAKVRPHEFDEA